MLIDLALPALELAMYLQAQDRASCAYPGGYDFRRAITAMWT